MVVFQYGSAVLFNIEDHEVESYLAIVQRHGSGLLPEMKKDGKFLCYIFLSFWVYVFSDIFPVPENAFLLYVHQYPSDLWPYKQSRLVFQKRELTTVGHIY